MMHTIRLLQSTEQIFAKGELKVRVENRDELLSIKAGNYSYEEILQMADKLIVSIEDRYKRSDLLEFPDRRKVEQTLISMRMELYAD